MIKKTILIITLLSLSVAGLFAQSQAVIRMRENLSVLTADSLMGRGSGTIYEYKAARYIEGVFKKEGITLLYPHPGQDFSILTESEDTLHSQNVVAVVQGWDPVLKNEYIIVGAHYDHLGFHKLTVDGKETIQIFYGADDNASGVATMLEVARMVNSQSFNFKRSILFVAFGAEERGMNGSWYFANRAFAPIDKVSLMINLDMVGRGIDGSDVSVYTFMPHTQLVALLKDISDMPLMITPQIHTADYFPSDHHPFASLGIPSLLFTTKLHNDYHTIKDTPDKIKYSTMEHLTQYVFNLVKTASNMQTNLVKTTFAVKDDEHQNPERVYSQNEVEKPATYMKGDQRRFMQDWVYHYLRYPSLAIELGIQGRVVVEFIIEKDGSVTDVQVTKSVHDLLDQEALRVVKVSPKWKPATLAGNPVRVKISVPVEFKLRK
ncbi:MAG: TonB family protein [Bacteroidales bacterium]